jgi:hypothetical protein
MDNPGLHEARRRIEAAARDKAGELDLGGLGLTKSEAAREHEHGG